jgi:sec-independent protein translocase protein TatA
MDLGAPELLIILVIGLLIFGSNKLPKLARSLGQASREFKSATSGDWPDITSSAASPATTTPTDSAAPSAPPAATTPTDSAAPSAPPAAPAPTDPAPPAHDEPPAGPGHPAG